VPPEMIDALGLVDEIWAGSTFVADAFTAVTAKPVRKLDVRVPEPTFSDLERTYLVRYMLPLGASCFWWCSTISASLNGRIRSG
jgi:hypothetical protein